MKQHHGALPVAALQSILAFGGSIGYFGNKINETICSRVILLFRSRLVGIEPRLRIGRSGVRIPAGVNYFFFSRLALGTIQPPMLIGVIFGG
jgi:hypothetical protein